LSSETKFIVFMRDHKLSYEIKKSIESQVELDLPAQCCCAYVYLGRYVFTNQLHICNHI